MKLAKILICIGLFSIHVMGDMAFSSMVARSSVTITAKETVAYYNAEKKKRKLTSDESKIFQFVQIANDVFKINDFVVYDHTNLDVKEKVLSADTIAKAIQNSLKQNINFDKPISTADLAKLNAVEDLIKKSLGADSFTVAWLNYKNGNKALAKTILNRGFDHTFDEAMKMQSVGLSNRNPIQDGEDFSTALAPLSTEAENKERGVRLKKMQIHVSNLPQIMT